MRWFRVTAAQSGGLIWPCILPLAGCGGAQSALASAGREAERIADLFWWDDRRLCRRLACRNSYGDLRRTRASRRRPQASSEADNCGRRLRAAGGADESVSGRPGNLPTDSAENPFIPAQPMRAKQPLATMIERSNGSFVSHSLGLDNTHPFHNTRPLPLSSIS
jgi:hypothetical protein